MLKPFLLPAWPLWPSPRLRPIPGSHTPVWDTTAATDSELDMVYMVAMDILDMLDMVIDSSTARGRLRPSLRPRPMLIPTSYTDMDMVLDMDMDMVLDTVDTDMVDTMVMDSDTTARGLLMLMPMPIPTTPMDLDTPDTAMDSMAMDMDMDSDTAVDLFTSARGLLMLSLRPRLILTTMVDTDTAVDSTAMDMDSDMPDLDMDMAMVCMDTESRLHQDLSVNQQLELRQKWIVISLNFPSPVLQFQCYHTRSLVMVSRKQENQSGKNPTNIKITKKKK